MLATPKGTTKYSIYLSKDSQPTLWRLYSYPPSQRITEDSKTKPSKSLDLGCWSKVSLRLGDDQTLEASIEEATASNDPCTNKIDPFKVEDQDSLVVIKEDKGTSSTNNAAQASVPKVEDREDLSSIPPMHLGGWLTSPFQWT